MATGPAPHLDMRAAGREQRVSGRFRHAAPHIGTDVMFKRRSSDVTIKKTTDAHAGGVFTNQNRERLMFKSAQAAGVQIYSQARQSLIYSGEFLLS
jgi:hypothetical protein